MDAFDPILLNDVRTAEDDALWLFSQTFELRWVAPRRFCSAFELSWVENVQGAEISIR